MGEKVLVVDDDLGVLRAVMRVLLRASYDVDGAPGGHAALAMIGAKDYDLVLSDIDMPSISGPTMMERALATGKVDRSRFLFMSGAQTGDAMRLVRSGFQVVKKPFETAVLLESVRATLLTRAPRRVTVTG